jgi:hypothetical protein
VGKKSVARNSRLEALRREQQRKERRRALVIYGTAGFVALALLAGIVIYSVVDNRSKAASHKVGYVAAPSSAATAANCTGTVNDASRGNTHVDSATTVNYDQAPPSSGHHDADPLPDAIHFYNPTSGIRIERAVHDLEHGFVVGWYDKKLPAAQVEELRKVAANAGDRFIAVPWTRSDFADNRHFVLTAWDRTQRCGTVSQDVVSDFVKNHVNPSAAGVTWDSPTASESGAAGGTLNVTADGPIPTAQLGASSADGSSTGGGTATAAPSAAASP